MSDFNILGTAKVSTQKKVTIIEKAMDALKIEPGDHIVFFQDKMSGNVVIRGQKYGGIN